MLGAIAEELAPPAARPPPAAAPAACRAARAREAEVYAALVLGLRDYVRKNGFKHVVLGLSGGIDSALVACVAADALGSEQRQRRGDALPLLLLGNAAGRARARRALGLRVHELTSCRSQTLCDGAPTPTADLRAGGSATGRAARI